MSERRQPVDWELEIAYVNAIMKRLKRKPKALKRGYSFSPGGILNAYREGDLTFNQAVRQLKKWKKYEQPQNRRITIPSLYRQGN